MTNEQLGRLIREAGSIAERIARERGADELQARAAADGMRNALEDLAAAIDVELDLAPEGPSVPFPGQVGIRLDAPPLSRAARTLQEARRLIPAEDPEGWSMLGERVQLACTTALVQAIEDHPAPPELAGLFTSTLAEAAPADDSPYRRRPRPVAADRSQT